MENNEIIASFKNYLADGQYKNCTVIINRSNDGQYLILLSYYNNKDYIEHPLQQFIDRFIERYPPPPNLLQRNFGYNADEGDVASSIHIPILGNNYIQMANIFKGIFIDYLVKLN